MPCCTLIAFLLSQIGVAAGAIKVRFFGGSGAAGIVPAAMRAACARWRWAGMAAAITTELLLASAAAPYLFTYSGRAHESFAGAWHICSVGAALVTHKLLLTSQ